MKAQAGDELIIESPEPGTLSLDPPCKSGWRFPLLAR
jgi:hypothetical protein